MLQFRLERSDRFGSAPATLKPGVTPVLGSGAYTHVGSSKAWARVQLDTRAALVWLHPAASQEMSGDVAGNGWSLTASQPWAQK